MSKNKIIIAVAGGSVLLIVLGFGGWFMWHKHTSALALTQNAAAISADAAGSTNLQATSGQSIPLTGTASTSSTQDSGGLSVSNGTGTGSGSMGQLDPSASLNVNGGSSGSSSSNSASSGSSRNSIDPTKFAQYDQYKTSPNAMFGDVVKGTGAALGANQKASVAYIGWLTNGTVFDQSRTGSDGKVQAFSFTEGAGQVIPGWEQGLSGMLVGGTRLIIVPPKLGYGATGQGSIPGDSVLVFEVQLLAVN
jgi:FKBP-type peptidyl-prolyl cis-trans isomerase FkpA